MKTQEIEQAVLSEILRKANNPTQQEKNEWNRIWAKYCKKQKEKNIKTNKIN